MERFVTQTLRLGEHLDLSTASENYPIFFQNAVPAPQSWHVSGPK
jgi:hypothetical protein